MRTPPGATVFHYGAQDHQQPAHARHQNNVLGLASGKGVLAESFVLGIVAGGYQSTHIENLLAPSPTAPDGALASRGIRAPVEKSNAHKGRQLPAREDTEFGKLCLESSTKHGSYSERATQKGFIFFEGEAFFGGFIEITIDAKKLGFQLADVSLNVPAECLASNATRTVFLSGHHQDNLSSTGRSGGKFLSFLIGAGFRCEADGCGEASEESGVESIRFGHSAGGFSEVPSLARVDHSHARVRQSRSSRALKAPVVSRITVGGVTPSRFAYQNSILPTKTQFPPPFWGPNLADTGSGSLAQAAVRAPPERKGVATRDFVRSSYRAIVDPLRYKEDTLMHSQRTRTVIDPIQFEVVRNALVCATEEMAVALRRSAYSTNIKTRADFSCGFFDRQLRTIAQSFAQPNHLGSLAKLVPWAISEYGVDRLSSGDGIVVNNPFHGGGHLNDLTLITPVYYHDELTGFVANTAHHVDVGGGAPASIGAFQEIYQEGVQVPPVKLVHGGKIDSDILSLVLAQVRAKRETAGDLRAQVAANNTGIQRLGDLFDRLGRDQVIDYIDELIAYTERRARAEIIKLPKGICEAVGYLDDDGFSDQSVRLQAQIEIRDDSVNFDLSGSDPQRRAPVNSTYAQTFANCSYALKCLIDPDIPVNDGFYRVLTVHAPEGSVVNAAHPAPVVGGWEVSCRLTDVIFKALSHLLPTKVPAGTKAMMCHAGFGGNDPRTGEYYCFLETVSGGYGGRYGKDGPDAVQTHGQNTENAPIEETEYNYPIQILHYGLLSDSEGGGRWRGGLGVERDYLFPDHDASFTLLTDRAKQAPWGLFGGESAKTAAYILNPDGEDRHLGTKVTVQLKPGDIVSYRTCGGGGYGNPLEREPALVVDDVRNGKVSIERARMVYGVEVNSTSWTYNPDETARLRATQ